MRFKEFFHLMEAFPLGWAKAYSKRNNPLYRKESPYHEALEKLFKGKDRLVYYIPPSTEVSENYIEQKISKFLNDHGYECFYYEGYAIRQGDRHKQKINIGRLLQRLESQDTETEVYNMRGDSHMVKGGEMLYDYKTDDQRLCYNKPYYVVISRHKYDIQGTVSDDRNWASCMTYATPRVVKGTGNYKTDIENYNKMSGTEEAESYDFYHGQYKDSKHPEPNSGSLNGYDWIENTIAGYLVRYDFDRTKDILRNPLDRDILKLERGKNGNVQLSDDGTDRDFRGTINNYEQLGKFTNFFIQESQKSWDNIVNLPTVDLKALYKTKV